MSTPSENILIMGLPGSGKTTFIAALQQYINGDIENKSLAQVKFSSNSEYINSIHSKWLRFREQERTIQEKSNKNVELYLKNLKSGDNITLYIPDFAGEIFSQQWDTRTWDVRYKEQLSDVSGIIYLIHPQTIKTHTLLTDAKNIADELGGMDDDMPKSEWDSSFVPTQVIAVELLQFHLDYLYKNKPIPVSIVISAWDKVNLNKPLLPNQWLKVNLPLLFQYLTSNDEILKFQVFGISAQGGDYKTDKSDDTTVLDDKLLNFSDPTERIKVQSGNNISNDIGEPLTWFLNNE